MSRSKASLQAATEEHARLLAEMLERLHYRSNVTLPLAKLGVYRASDYPKDGYQRDLNEDFVARAMQRGGYSEFRAGTIYVGRRPDNSHWVADGQNRVGIAIRSKLEKINNCCVFESTGPDMEAGVFLMLDERKNLGPQVKFVAGLANKEPECLELVAICRRAGFKLGLTKPDRAHVRWGMLGCPISVLHIYRRFNNVAEMLKLFVDGWNTQVDTMRNEVVMGTAQFLHFYKGEFDCDRLVKLMRQNPATATYVDSRNYVAGFGSSQGARFAGMTEALVELYNKRLGKDSKLVSFHIKRKTLAHA